MFGEQLRKKVPSELNTLDYDQAIGNVSNLEEFRKKNKK